MTPDEINPQYDLREANRVRQLEWDAGNNITLGFRTNELFGEAGEAANVVKKLERERMGIAGSRATVDHLLEELADVVICLDLIGLHFDIDSGFNEPWGEEHYIDGDAVSGRPLLVSNKLASSVGDICGMAYTSGQFTVDLNLTLLSNHLKEATWVARRIGACYWRSVNMAVEHKFNATSEKLNLKTRFIRQ